MKRFLRICGLLAVLVGLLWIGQGTGLVPYPSYSFMIGHGIWAWYGAGLALVGAVALFKAFRRP